MNEAGSLKTENSNAGEIMLASLLSSPLFWVIAVIGAAVLAIVYSACIVGGRADDVAERQLRNAMKKNGSK